MISKIIKSYTYVLQKKKSVFIFLITSFFLGFVLGLFFKRNTASFGYIVTKYYNVTFGLYSNPFKLLLIRIIINLFYFVLIYFLTYKKLFLIFAIFLLGYRGFVLGRIFNSFISILGFEGLIFYLFIILIQNLLTTLAIIVTITELIYKREGSCKELFSQELIKNVIKGYLLSLLAPLYEFVVLVCIIRPLNIFF